MPESTPADTPAISPPPQRGLKWLWQGSRNRLRRWLGLGRSGLKKPTLGKLNIYEDSWKLSERDCPCDVQFVEYLNERKLSGKMIFHFGTGEHHHIAKENMKLAGPNEILGVTASPAEYQAYIDYIIEEPRAACFYKVLFVDIYTLTPRMLPNFDLITLFHLCEFYDEANALYTPLNDETLLRLFIAHLNPGGRLLFYTGSMAYQKTARLLEQFEAEGTLTKSDEFKKLVIYSAGD